MKVAILTAQIAPYHDARFIGAAKNFDEVHVLSSVNQGDFDEFLAKFVGGYSVYKLFNGRREYEAAARKMDVAHRTKQVLIDISPDAIAVAGWSAPESLAALDFGRKNGKSVIVMSESQEDDAPRSALRETVKGRVVSQFDSALVGGPPHADYVAKLGIPRERVHLGYNAVDNAYFARGANLATASQVQLRTQCRLPERYLLASARFIAKKNLPNLIRAYALARRRHTTAPDLVILGDGPERAAIEAEITANSVEEFVHLPGFRDYDALPAYYALSEGFLHVSSTEQWGLVINEAMACSVPVIATHNCGAARTVIRDGVSGVLTDIDIASIAAALSRFFKMTQEQRLLMGVAAAEAIHSWGPEKFGTGLRAAVDCAQAIPRRGPLKPWDQALLGQMQRKVIDAVS